MPRINHVKRARKAQGSCRCGTAIKKGDPYKWIKKRYGAKKVRCENCAFRASDMTGGRLGEVYASQENAEDSLSGWDGDIEDLRAVLQDFAEEIRDHASEYQNSADSIREHFETSDTADDCEEKAQELESWADEIEGVDLDDYDGPEYDPEDEEAEPPEEWTTWRDEQSTKVEEVIGSCPL